MKKIKLPHILTFLSLLLIYFLPALFFKVDIDFYNSLNGFHLPPWVFMTMWSIIYLTMSIFITYYIFYFKKTKNSDYKRLFFFIIINYLLQVAFVPIFFDLQNLFLSYIDALFVFVTILLITLESLVLNKKATLLLIPYLAWSIIASILSITFYLRN